MLTISQGALEDLAALLSDVAGLKVAPDGYHGLRLALRERMPKVGATDAREYVRGLRQGGGDAELRELLPLVTVGHTEFFRDRRQFLALESTILPGLLERARAEGRPAAIWSAGCATGEEPYSIAMLLAEAAVGPKEADLRGTDLNAQAIASARVGRYGPRRMAQVSPERVRRFFEPLEDAWRIAPEIRERVRFEAANLADADLGALPASLDLILCRNVIIYFDHATIRALLDRFFEVLRPGGHLVLGYSESLFRVHDRFEMIEVTGAFLYRRPVSAHAPRRAPAPGPVAPPAPPGPRPDKVRPTPSLVALERPAAEAQPRTARVREAAALMEAGRFAEALGCLEAGAREAPDDVAVLLTLGNLHALMSKCDDAQRVFDEVLAKEPLCVDAHVYGAMSAMQAGAWDRARKELGRAIFLEPSLALAHFLAAEVAARAGDRASARRAYRNAIAQLIAPQRPLFGFCPDLPDPAELGRAARYALAALEEGSDAA